MFPTPLIKIYATKGSLIDVLDQRTFYFSLTPILGDHEFDATAICGQETKRIVPAFSGWDGSESENNTKLHTIIMF